ncbi:hypothetical protein DFH08DRAFT_792176 [Mycena albidolilacea]|uniref:Heterokaryon incompatibility domain-containing protein n=1 Tax=Mycena albidolilacea TaxID=1033008 RepID=A0AAD6Z7M1_9AGAR|nr:hypothetical protein DFH08DRAFT_792176 [Mycena albidolilacea]
MEGKVTTATDLGARAIYELPLLDVHGKIQNVSIRPDAKDGRIRMLDCVAFVADEVLRIWEFPEPPLKEFENFTSWPDFKYSAISYVWKGNPTDQSTVAAANHSGYLTVEGAEKADPISIDVLRAACLASLKNDGIGRWRMVSRAEYLWLDRLCIVQTSRADKNFQISQMYRVYKCCTQCLILPGGIGRLVPLDEETAWANRAWTLQECLAPHYPLVLFTWTMGTAKCIGTSAFRLKEVGHGTGCALARFIDVVRACIDQPMRFTACPLDAPLMDWSKPEAGTPVDIRVFGKGHADLFALRQARMNFQNTSEPDEPASTRRCYSMIWRCALMRASSRPVDMVLSIMSLMGVSLDPAAFGKDDRLQATRALATEIVNNGGSADWLGMPAGIPPCPQMSTFPQFAKTDVSGSSEFLVAGRWCSGRALDDWFFAPSNWEWPDRGHLWPWERLYGSIDEAGYLKFKRKACAVTPATANAPSGSKFQWPVLQAMDGTVWRFQDDTGHGSGELPKMAAIPLWRFEEQPKVNEYGIADMQFGRRAIKFMLVKQHTVGKFNVVSYFYVYDEDQKTWKSRVEEWKEYQFEVGGPEPLLTVRTNEA